MLIYSTIFIKLKRFLQITFRSVYPDFQIPNNLSRLKCLVMALRIIPYTVSSQQRKKSMFGKKKSLNYSDCFEVVKDNLDLALNETLCI